MTNSRSLNQEVSKKIDAMTGMRFCQYCRRRKPEIYRTKPKVKCMDCEMKRRKHDSTYKEPT